MLIFKLTQGSHSRTATRFIEYDLHKSPFVWPCYATQTKKKVRPAVEKLAWAMYLAGIPAHIVQRGNNRDACFFSDDDYLFYLEVLAQGLRRYKVE